VPHNEIYDCAATMDARHHRTGYAILATPVLFAIALNIHWSAKRGCDELRWSLHAMAWRTTVLSAAAKMGGRTILHITSSCAVAAVLAAAAVGLADPAWADDLSGPYTVLWSDDSPATTLTFTPCGTECSEVTGDKGWRTEAHLVGDKWVMGPVRTTHRCSDGSNENETANGSFDAATLNGSSVITYPIACPEDPPGGLTVRFNLIKFD
jgi:hypothetical protein